MSASFVAFHIALSLWSASRFTDMDHFLETNSRLSLIRVLATFIKSHVTCCNSKPIRIRDIIARNRHTHNVAKLTMYFPCGIEGNIDCESFLILWSEKESA